MNIELKPIAESKIRQLGGDVCGVLVRKDEKLAAVDEHGRVQWLRKAEEAEEAEAKGRVLIAMCRDLKARVADMEAARTQPAQQGSVPSRDDLIQCLLATQRQSEGVMADAILSMFTGAPTAPQLTAPQPEGDVCGEVQAVANMVCGELPEGWVINLCMENGAAWVEAIKPTGYTIDIDRADLSLVEQIGEAMRLATEAERAGGEQ